MNPNNIKSQLGIHLPIQEIKDFCQRNYINKLALFGSVLRDDFTASSDVDILVEFQPGKSPGWDIVLMEDELSKMIKTNVDLRTPAELSSYIRDRVMSEAKVIYERN
ncbi:MAG: nucleotidyltransferase family protein [Xenococcaceae cyanobacterium MO_167.B27]|nr:nucleotidyltransferase family protein [Xenococcaceae cyanobacterium MO_167.B27]